jgi:hypothetical protein
MKMTKHAEMRSRQRGFSPEILKIIMQYGHISEAPGSAFKLFFGNREFSQAICALKKMIQVLERAKGGTMILGNDHSIVTCYKQR